MSFFGLVFGCIRRTTAIAVQTLYFAKWEEKGGLNSIIRWELITYDHNGLLNFFYLLSLVLSSFPISVSILLDAQHLTAAYSFFGRGGRGEGALLALFVFLNQSMYLPNLPDY